MPRRKVQKLDGDEEIARACRAVLGKKIGGSTATMAELIAGRLAAAAAKGDVSAARLLWERALGRAPEAASVGGGAALSGFTDEEIAAEFRRRNLGVTLRVKFDGTDDPAATTAS